MFRNSQLFQRFEQVAEPGPEQDPRPMAILADDEAAEAGILKPILEGKGFRVVEANDGSVALDLAQRHSAKLVVAALDLPGLSGYQLCQKLRLRSSMENIPFILITYRGELPDKLMGHQTFASDYVQRPINLHEFESRLSSIWRAHTHAGVEPAPENFERTPAPRIQREQAEGTTTALQDLEPATEVSTSISETGEMIQKILTEFHSSPAGGRMPGSENAPEPPITHDAGELAIGSESEAEELSRGYLDQREISEESAILYKETFAFLLNIIRHLEKEEIVGFREGLAIARRIVDSLTRDKGLLLLATDRTTEFSLTQHCANVAVIAARTGQSMGMPGPRVVRLCLAGILHDIGSVKIPAKLLFKQGAPTPEERVEIERRPIYSAEMVSSVKGFKWLAQMVGQVYERDNGRGYPQGLKGKDISEEALLLGISDVFEACVHQRPYRRAMTGYQAIQNLTTEVDAFPERITKALIRGFSVYPFNEYVELNTGEIGRVVDISAENSLRPTIKVLYSADGEPQSKTRLIDLTRHVSLFITRAIRVDELPKKD